MSNTDHAGHFKGPYLHIDPLKKPLYFRKKTIILITARDARLKHVLILLAGTMEKLHKCTDCPFTVTTGRQLSDYRRKEHGVQNVICPYCPKYAEFKTLSALKRHPRLLHPLHDEKLFRETGTMYYFAVKSSAYHSISKHVPGPSSATVGRA